MRRHTLIALLVLLTAALLIPAASASASDVSINNAVAKRSGKLNTLATSFNSSVTACNNSQLKSCGALFRNAKKLRTATVRTARAVKKERSSSKLGAKTKRVLLKSFKSQKISIEATTGFIRANRRRQLDKAERLRKRGARYGRIAQRNATLAQKLLKRIVAKANG